MIFVGLNSSGITVYDCNSALNGEPIGSCYIHQWDISYNTLISYYSTGGISLYHAANYESIYGNGDDLFYDDSVNFVIVKMAYSQNIMAGGICRNTRTV